MCIVWFTNVGTVNSNYGVGFKASTENRQTFGPITNVSNTDNYDLVNAEISAEGDNAIVSYWEQNEILGKSINRWWANLWSTSVSQTMRLEV